MGKARQAVWVSAQGDLVATSTVHGRHDAERWGWTEVFVLPKVPDDAVIEAMAKGMYSEALPGRSWDRCPEDVKQHWRRYARAAYAALRGAMQ